MPRSRPRSRAPSLAALRVAVAALGTLAVAAPAAGDGEALIEPRVDRMAFVALIEEADLGDEVRTVAEMLYSDYASGFDALRAGTEARLDAAGRKQVEEALAGRAFVAPDDLRRMRVAILAAMRESWPEADRLFASLIDDARSLIDDEDGRARVERALRPLYRHVFLSPRRAEEMEETYAGDGVDVIALLGEARAEGGELTGMDIDSLRSELDAYEAHLHELLLASWPDERRARSELAAARVARDAPGQARLEADLLELWTRRYALQRTAVAAIGDVAERRLGPAARQRWQQRFDAAIFPRLFAASGAEKRHEWIMRRRIDETVQERATEIMGRMRDEHAQLCREAAAIMLRGRLQHGVVVHDGLDASRAEPAVRELFEELLRNSGRRSKLDADVSAELEALLTDGQRRQMKADIAAAAHGRRR
jgi:hypothetical protein